MRRLRDEYWRLRRKGFNNTKASILVGVHRRQGTKWLQEADSHGAARSRSQSTRYLSVEERERIADGRRQGLTTRAIASGIGRAASTVSRELRRNADPRNGRYGPYQADRRAEERARRPKQRKVESHPPLMSAVRARLKLRWSPKQISATLRREFPDDARMQVSAETIYQAIYVQGRGELRRELARCLRTGRAVRKPQRSAEARRPRFFDDALLISERPAEAEDRAVPGHWEGDLIIGKDNASAIGTLVERSTRYVMLVHLPDGYKAEQARDGVVATIKTLPKHLWRSLTWDQGPEMAKHAAVTVATDLPIFFCDPASPWQRGSNENTNGVLRQYFPKGTDLAQHSAQDLVAVAAELNGRPRQTLGWATPAEKRNELLLPAT